MGESERESEGRAVAWSGGDRKTSAEVRRGETKTDFLQVQDPGVLKGGWLQLMMMTSALKYWTTFQFK